MSHAAVSTRFIILHATNRHWESGARPTSHLIERVGELLAAATKEAALLGAEGLRPTSQGVRLRFMAGAPTIVKGPFEPQHELAAGFSIVRGTTLDDAIDFATREAETLGDVEIDIRPVTEPWDMGLADPPADAQIRRYMVLRKATPMTEAGEVPTPAQRTELARLIEETTRRGLHVVTETMRPSRRGRRYKNSREGVVFYDGPFLETKELLGGYMAVSAASMDEAGRWAEQYIRVVGADVVDLRELE
jgi:hypothetical protein